MAHQSTKERAAAASPSATQAAIAGMLTGQDGQGDSTRFDCHPKFTDLSAAVDDLCGLARCADLVMNDVLNSVDPRGVVEGYTSLLLVGDQIRAFRWIVSALGSAAKTADEAVEELEDIAASQRLMVRVDAKKGGRS